MRWNKEELRRKFDAKARENYMSSDSFAATFNGLDGIPFVRRDAICDFIISILDESEQSSEESQDELWEDAVDILSKMPAANFHARGIIELLASKFEIRRKQQ